MTNLQKLLESRTLIDAQIKTEQQAAKAAAIIDIRYRMKDLGIEAHELAGKRAQRPAKYVNPQTGQTWTGQGRAPKWFDRTNPAQLVVG